MNTSKFFIEKFLAYVERDPVLWDSKNKLYGNSNTENAGWEYISLQLNELYKGKYASGASLHNLWLSLLSLREEYNRDKGRIGYGFVDKMNFLEAKNNKEENIESVHDQSGIAFVKHILANIVFMVIYIIMTVKGSFTGTFKDCRDSLYPLFFAWCVVSGLSAIAAYSTIKKNLSFKNALPIVMLLCYAIVCAATYLFSQPLPSVTAYSYYGNFRKEVTTPKCPTQHTTFSCAIMVFIGFPVAIGLSFCYHVIQITSRSACISSWKIICAAYYGSAITFLFFMATIDWHGAYFLFFIWILVNAKFANDGVLYAWKAHKEVLKERYCFTWNPANDQFQIVLNGNDQSSKLSEVAVIPVKTDKLAAKLVS